MTGAHRWFDLPDVPTMVELGYKDFIADTFQGFLAPAKTPPAVVELLASKSIEILKKPAIAAQLRDTVSGHIALSLEVARHVPAHVRPGGCLILLSGTGGRSPRARSTVAAVTAAMPALTRSLALELAPVRVNTIAPGFVDTPLSARLLGDDLEARRDELRRTLPIRRVVGPADVAALAVHLMTNTALTGATYDIDGGQQLLD